MWNISKLPDENRAVFFSSIQFFAQKKRPPGADVLYKILLTNYATDLRMMFSAAPALNHSICCSL
jgi:hypothetical protein